MAPGAASEGTSRSCCDDRLRRPATATFGAVAWLRAFHVERPRRAFPTASFEPRTLREAGCAATTPGRRVTPHGRASTGCTPSGRRQRRATRTVSCGRPAPVGPQDSGTDPCGTPSPQSPRRTRAGAPRREPGRSGPPWRAHTDGPRTVWSSIPADTVGRSRTSCRRADPRPEDLRWPCASRASTSAATDRRSLMAHDATPSRDRAEIRTRTTDGPSSTAREKPFVAVPHRLETAPVRHPLTPVTPRGGPTMGTQTRGSLVQQPAWAGHPRRPRHTRPVRIEPAALRSLFLLVHGRRLQFHVEPSEPRGRRGRRTGPVPRGTPVSARRATCRRQAT